MNKRTEAVIPDELYHVIVGTASQDPKLMMASANRLKQMLDMHGTFDGLSAIACQRTLSLSIRQQSIIQFKNVALSHWKARRLISEEQKTEIRVRSLTLLDESDDTIAECNKHIIAKIARQDFPAAWPNLINYLLASCESSLKQFVDSGGNDQNGTLILRRSLEIINSVLKEFSSVRMPVGLQIMGQLIGNLHQVLEGYYSTLSNIMNSVMNADSVSTATTANAILLSHLTYKCICKMALWTWNRLALKTFTELLPWVEVVFNSSASQLKALSESRIAITLALGYSQGFQPSNPVVIRSLDYLTRHVRQFGKLFRRMQQLSSGNFVSIQTSSELVLYYWSKVVQATNGPPEYMADTPWAVFPVRFLVQAMSLFKDSLGKWSLKRGGSTGASTFSREFVEEAVKLLITRFIPLNPKDLNAWSTDPEEWMNMEDQENEQWEFELRPCGERVLVVLANHYGSYVIPLVQAIFNTVAVKPAVSLEEIVQKEAIYCAIGRCAIYLENKIPLQEWISQNLIPEANDTNPNFPIIKRRIAWVLGKLVSDECLRPDTQLWDILLHLLSDHGSGSDLAVRFASAVAISECVDSLKFDIEVFSSYSPLTISRLISLISEVDTSEAKRRIIKSLNLTIETSGEHIVPYMENIANQIPPMWISAEGDFLYKGALLETVTKLTEAAKEKSTSLDKITIPLLQESLSDSSRAALDQDALILWASALRNATTLTSTGMGPSLLELFPIAITLLGENLDLLGSITAIVESYLVLDATTVVQVAGDSLFRAFLNALEKAIQTNQKDVIRVLRTLVQLCPAQVWAGPVHQANLFAYFMKILDDDKANVVLLTDYILLCSRIAVNDPLILSQLLSASASVLQMPETKLWESLLDQWWRRFDNMHEPRQRKLAAMGIAALVATGRPEVLQRLSGEIFNLWLDVFGEMKEALNDISHADPESTLSRLITFWKDNGSVLPSELDEVQDAPEYDRWTRIYQSDPVEIVKLTAFVGEKLRLAQQIYGPDFEHKFLRDADPTVVKQLWNELAS